MTIKILHGSCLDTLKTLPEQSINTCITSPPYWGLRDYGTAEWEGGDKNCPHMRTTKIGKDTSTGHKAMFEQGNVVGDAIYKSSCPECGAIRKDSQLGLEETPEEFVRNLVQVFKEVKRVLRDDGTVWLNLGDSYSGSGKGPSSSLNKAHHDLEKTHSKIVPDNLKPKDLVGIPWRVAFALQADGWYLRQDIIWHKPNPMPESVQDRCTKAHEYIFLLSKNPKYYYDNEAIKEDSIYAPDKTKEVEREKGYYDGKWSNPEEGSRHDGSFKAIREKKNKRSVWSVSPKAFKGAHFATFPPDLIEPCVLAGCPEKVCVDCNEPYVREMKIIEVAPKENIQINDKRKEFDSSMGGGGTSLKGHSGHFKEDGTPVVTPKEDLGLKKQCDCVTNKAKSGTVLDPFGGSGTTAQVANGNNRDAVLCELNKEYIEIAKQRIAPHGDLFIDIEVV
tara:strand:- start:8 stop:1348 length:1341 start_codon:yes stop_codon:yes gene_type:complete